MYNLLFSFILSLPLAVQATTFRPITIKQQIQEADGVVYGKVQYLVSKYDKDGQIFTQASILADKWHGLETKFDEVVVNFPGGKFNGKVRNVHGSPKFIVGEKVVLFTKSIGNQNWVQNLGLGKFSLKKVGRNFIIVNQVFPSYPRVSQMDLKKFFALTENLKQKKLKERFKDKYEINDQKRVGHYGPIKNSRSIASINDKIEDERISSPWLVLILGLLGVVFQLFRKKKNQ